MVELTEIKGVGPTKAETLEEEGYESVEDIAQADPDELSEVNGVGEDRALEYMVNAGDLLDESEDEPEDGENFDLTPAEVADEVEESSDDDESDSSSEDEETVGEEPDAAQDAVSGADDEATDESEESEPESYEVGFEFSSRTQYDVFHAALMRQNERTSHQPATDLMEKCLSGLYGNEKEVTYQLSEYELNTLHAAVKQARTGFQGANDIEQMEALKEVEAQLDAAREEYLF